MRRIKPTYSIYILLFLTVTHFVSLQNAGAQGKTLMGGNLAGKKLSGYGFQNANLMGASLENADLNNADFREANLIRTDFKGADLKNADFTDADLWGANFTNADLRGAVFENTNLWGAHFENADLRNTTLDIEMIKNVKTLYKAKLDPGVRDNVKKECGYLLAPPQPVVWWDEKTAPVGENVQVPQ